MSDPQSDLACHICGQSASKTPPAFPFCTLRCKTIGMGSWLDGSYEEQLLGEVPETQALIGILDGLGSLDLSNQDVLLQYRPALPAEDEKERARLRRLRTVPRAVMPFSCDIRRRLTNETIVTIIVMIAITALS